jgi:hypothetical protein
MTDAATSAGSAYGSYVSNLSPYRSDDAGQAPSSGFEVQ